MTKRKYDLSIVLMAFMVVLLPVLGSIWDKTFVIYASLSVCLFALGYRVYKYSRISITKISLFLFIMAAYSLIQLIWVSDKGSQVAFSCVLLTATFSSMVVNDIKNTVNEEKITKDIRRLIYLSSLVYAVCVFLHQLFIESNLLLGKMDFNNGSARFTAFFMLCGIISCLKLFYRKKKSVGFYVSLVFMICIFIMTGSLMGYLMLAVVILYITATASHKRMEVFGAGVAVVVLSVINLIYAVVAIATGKVDFNGSFKGLVNIVGIGKGGYKAANSILESGYVSNSPLFAEMMEISGIIGLSMLVLGIFFAFMVHAKGRNLPNFLFFAGSVCMAFSTAEALCFTLFIFVCFYSLREKGTRVSLSGLWGIVAFIPMLFFAFLSFARIPGFIGQNSFDLGQYGKAAEMYAFGAKCELFNSDGWEKAYLAAEKAYEAGDYSLDLRGEYLENAIKFNPSNYLYRKYLAKVYSDWGNVTKALEIWDGIMLRYDKESLYVEYAEKICDVMEKGQVDLPVIEELYNTITEYANKATDSEIKLLVNNILTKSQQYYIEKREGKQVVDNALPIVEFYEYETETAEVEW